jgi:acetyl-CoA carboxylase biotin carboxylase subunit
MKDHSSIKKVLVANRGEIAVRIIKTLRKMGIISVAVYSDADRKAFHVSMADEAVYIGESPSSDSYLRQDKILEAALAKKVDAIHPGYGFLSENPTFAQLLEVHQIILIGPTADSMRIMGDKLASKEAVKHYNIPLVPGTDFAIDDPGICKKIAAEIGYPILIKASAGGGGKGMRLVTNDTEMDSQLAMAMGEALAAFGDSSVFVEKYVEKPRHIEFQILADQYGNTVHLFERECSIQRRHQKVIEEAPSSILSEELRKTMGEAAVNVAKSCNYRGAGTVEFLLDKNNKFYFLEMNTRLQVEHPITEMITGLDLVEQQIRVAKGEKLKFEQKELTINGHAIELRVYAEDPCNNFLPSINTLSTYKIPYGDGIRVDHGFLEGDIIPIYYDPMIAKLVVYGENRDAAIYKMKQAIHDYIIIGIETTLNFGCFVMDHPNFISGDFDTSFIQKYWNGGATDYPDHVMKASAAFAATLQNKN